MFLKKINTVMETNESSEPGADPGSIDWGNQV